MAIRRISDLGELSTAVTAPELSDCLIEVSYPRGNADAVDHNTQYESYYVNGSWIAQKAGTELNPATKSTLGVVKIGSNVDVDSNGEVSVPKATTAKYGVVKLPTSSSGGTVGVIGVNENGELFDNTNAYTGAQATQRSFELSTVFNMMYPVGSVYITMLGNEPPFKDGYAIDGTPVVACTWKKIADNCTLWSEPASSLPQQQDIDSSTDPADSSFYEDESLPKPPAITCNAAGEHTHKAPFPAADYNSNHTAVTKYTGSPTFSRETNAGGTHTHEIGYSGSWPSAYKDNTGTTFAPVRPNGFKCAMWVRVA